MKTKLLKYIRKNFIIINKIDNKSHPFIKIKKENNYYCGCYSSIKELLIKCVEDRFGKYWAEKLKTKHCEIENKIKYIKFGNEILQSKFSKIIFVYFKNLCNFV